MVKTPFYVTRVCTGRSTSRANTASQNVFYALEKLFFDSVGPSFDTIHVLDGIEHPPLTFPHDTYQIIKHSLAAKIALRPCCVVFSFPEYHHSIPGRTKNFFDHLDKGALDDVPVLIIAEAGGDVSPVSSIQHATTIARALGADVLTKSIAISRTTTDDEIAERIPVVAKAFFEKIVKNFRL